jgi:hypothetical protein
VRGGVAEHVPWALLGLRCAPKEESGVSAEEAVYGFPLVLPNQVQASKDSPPQPPPPAAPEQQPEAERSRTYAEVVAGTSQPLWEAAYVYVRRGNVAGPFQPPYSSPYEVLRRRQKVFDLQVGERVETVSVDRLKPHRGAAPVSPTAPPRRGRPPGSGGSSSSPPSPTSSPSLGGGHVAADICT